MKTFKRKATLEELRSACTKRGWNLETKKFEEGSDFVSFKFKIGRTNGIALVNTFNGRVIGELSNGEHFSDDTAKHEGKRWFNALLEVAYIS